MKLHMSQAPKTPITLQLYLIHIMHSNIQFPKYLPVMTYSFEKNIIKHIFHETYFVFRTRLTTSVSIIVSNVSILVVDL